MVHVTKIAMEFFVDFGFRFNTITSIYLLLVTSTGYVKLTPP